MIGSIRSACRARLRVWDATCFPPPNLTRRHWKRFLATQAGKGSWSSLSPTEQAAWKTFQYTEDSWEGRRPRPPWKEWSELTLEEQAAAQHGLGVHSKADWQALAPTTIPSLASLLDGSYDSDNDHDSNSTTTSTALVAQETRDIRQKQTTSSPLVQTALNTVKGLAPVVGPIVSSAAAGRGRGSQGLGLAVVGSLLEQVPTIMDASSGILDVTGVDTVLYLDDSGSMQGSNLCHAKNALQSLESRLKTDDQDRFWPTRIVKFGNRPLVLNPSEEDWSVSLVNMAWDGTSGGTYMWKMMEDDLLGKYRPAGGKLRVVVITDGVDNLSPAPYSGVRGFDPLMQTMASQGYDIEWHIIVVGNYGWTKEISDQDQRLYQSLCHATGGQFVSLGESGWDEEEDQIAGFLDAVEDSGYDDNNDDRRKRQEQYRIEAGKGRVENFKWLPLLPDGKGDKK